MFDLLDQILGRRPVTAESLLGSILELLAAMSVFREPNHIGPGARNGVGSPKRRIAAQQAT